MIMPRDGRSAEKGNIYVYPVAGEDGVSDLHQD